MWYFNHFDYDLTAKKKSKSSKVAISFDPTISELMWLVIALRRKVLDHRKSLQIYFLKNMQQVLPRLCTLIEEALENPGVKADNVGFLFNALADDLSSILRNVDPKAVTFDCPLFEVFRLNWIRFQACCVLPHAIFVIPKLAEIHSIIYTIQDQSK